MKKLLILLLPLIFSTNSAFAMKGPEEGGVLIILKESKPCFYLKNSESTPSGTIERHRFSLNNSTLWDNKNDEYHISHSGEMPVPKNPDSCFSFPHSFDYRLNDVYTVNSSDYTYSNFCLVENNGRLQVNQVVTVKDAQYNITEVCSDKEYSNDRGFWYKIKRFFSRVF